ncbi:MAG: 4-hydroxy-3-methylbut-2-enyl diphosphate reductase [Deferribacteres bacterium]|nr:4-hydroxy-3-methylbut-2-enyl diphosphate reductase [Deferribacteres bacterium]
MERDGVVICVASKAGFCFGVKRAVQIAFDASEKWKEVYTIGPLIHNPQVVSLLEENGIRVLSSLEEVPHGATVVIRSHGIPLDDLRKLRDKGVRIIDATCPFVKKAQEIVSNLVKKGYLVAVVGEAEHPEVKALLSYGEGKAFIYKDIPEGAKKIGVVSQTTQILSDFFDAVSRIMKGCEDFTELRVFNTVCQSTAERQLECKNMAAKVEVLIVVGGKNSANTKRLVEIASDCGVKAYHIEVPDELDVSWFFDKKMIGITAGASTPDWIIDAVVDRVKKLTGGIVQDGRVQRDE